MNMDTNVIRNRESARKNIPDVFLHLDLWTLSSYVCCLVDYYWTIK